MKRMTENITDKHHKISTLKYVLCTASIPVLQPAARMTQLLVLVLGACGLASPGRQFVPLFAREPRSLRDTFPFNQDHGDQHEHHEHHHQDQDNIADVGDFFRDDRQVPNV